MSEELEEDYVFPGFYDPRLYDGYTKLPHEFIDEALAKIDNLAELKIVLYVLRHTWGFQEYDGYKKITIEEFAHGRIKKDDTRMDDGTGLGLTAVKDGIKKAVEHEYIEEFFDDTNPWRIKKGYRLKLRNIE